MIPTDGFDSKECIACERDVEPEIRDDPPNGFKVRWICRCNHPDSLFTNKTIP